jgi:hypothetical protein
VIRIIRTNTGKLSPGTSLETRRPLEVRQREQQELITREVELLRRRLPAIRLSFTYQLEDFLELVRESPSTWKREKLALSSLLTGIPLSLAECLVDPNLGSRNLWAEELSIRPDDLAVLSGTPGQHFSKRRVIDPEILDPESDYWEQAWQWWTGWIENPDQDPQNPWNADAYLEDIAAAHDELREGLSAIHRSGDHRGVHVVGPFSLLRMLMSDRRRISSWPQGDGLVALWIIIDGAQAKPVPHLTINDVNHSGGRGFAPPECRALASWEWFLDEDRWTKCFMRWACLE